MAEQSTAELSELERLEWYRRMREAEPVWRDPKSGVWSVFRYQDVAAILADHEAFSSDFSQVLPDLGEVSEGNILAMDPPYHHQLRGLVSQAFTPRSIAALEERIGQVAEQLLDQVEGRTQIELVGDLAYPLPVTVIAELLGVPAADRPRFKTWADALFTQDSVDPTDEAALKAAIDSAAATLRNFHDYLRDHIAERRARPRHDLLSDLVAAEIDGQRLRDEEIAGFATILLIAGHITTTVLLGNALLCLDEHPEAQAALRANPAAIPDAIEEILRYRSPVVQTSRVTAREIELGGQLIPPRQVVSPCLLSANHDERQFENPDAFLIDRRPNPHVAFGRGIHFCIGAPLARLEARVALALLLRRFSRLRVDRDQPLERFPRVTINGVRALEILVEPA